jgi:hypothetical protein
MFGARVSGGSKVVWADLEFAGVDIDNDHFAVVIAFDARADITLIDSIAKLGDFVGCRLGIGHTVIIALIKLLSSLNSGPARVRLPSRHQFVEPGNFFLGRGVTRKISDFVRIGLEIEELDSLFALDVVADHFPAFIAN